MTHKALTIAGSDCSGGAGIQADLKTFSAHGVFGMSVITSVVAENTFRVIDIMDVRADIIEKQIDAVFEDIPPDSVKIGMLGSIETMLAVAEKIKGINPENIVIDPVMYAKNGAPLMAENSIKTLISEVVPLADLITPNIPEAEKMANMKIETEDDMKKSAVEILKMGCKSVLIKGGHSVGNATDILYDGKEFRLYSAERINTKNTHGTGCTFSSAIAANLALGADLQQSIERAKNYVTNAIRYSLPFGKGNGPVNHFWEEFK
jgi:hydroxymethylpyrimidine/phosphomethylpyrimidine kinase